eukprot:751799-Hanusia_phi.AAC.1
MPQCSFGGSQDCSALADCGQADSKPAEEEHAIHEPVEGGEDEVDVMIARGMTSSCQGKMAEQHVEEKKSQIHRLARMRSPSAQSDRDSKGEEADPQGLLPPEDEAADDEGMGNSDAGMGGDGSDLDTIPFNAAKARAQKLYQVGKRVPGSRARGGQRMRQARGGLMLASNSTGEEGEEERHEIGWVKDWWTARAWFLWTISGPTVTVLIFVLNTLTQGWMCGLIYVAILLPLDVATYYWDIYAYDNGEDVWR